MGEVTADHADLGAVFDGHMRHEFVDRDVDATMATMNAEPYVDNVLVMTGGVGREELQRFYAEHFTGRWPADMGITPVSQTLGAGQVVDEMVIGFTQDLAMDWLLPGVRRTGRHVELPVVVVMVSRAARWPTSTSTGTKPASWCRSACSTRVGCRSPASSRRASCSTRRCRPTC
jgi:carboxymethylenebutenolidase